MKKNNYTNRFKIITSKKFEGGYYVEIQIDSIRKDNLIVDFYIWNEIYKIKMHMFGFQMKDLESMYNHFREMCWKESRIDLLENNQTVIPYAINMIIEPQIEKYIEIYKEEYEDEE